MIDFDFCSVLLGNKIEFNFLLFKRESLLLLLLISFKILLKIFVLFLFSFELFSSFSLFNSKLMYEL